LFIEPARLRGALDPFQYGDTCPPVDKLTKLLDRPTATQPSPRFEAIFALSKIGFPPGYSARKAAILLGISQPHFSYLFRAKMGLPFRRWVLWQRLMSAVSAIVHGEDHTQAAYQAGFSDSAHFARTMKRMFGIPVRALGLSV
jgi:AraC-like DNA-binding protein